MNIRISSLLPLLFLVVIILSSFATLAVGYSLNLPPSKVSNLNDLLGVFNDSSQGKIVDAFEQGVQVLNTPQASIYKPFLLVAYKQALMLAREYAKIKYYIPLPNGIVVAHIVTDREGLVKIAGLPGVLNIMPSPSLEELFSGEEKLKLTAGEEKPPLPAQATGTGGYSTFSSLDILGVKKEWSTYGFKGKGVIVGVVDTGIDFTTPELGLDAVARDASGTPLIVVNDEHIALTPITVVRDSNGYLNTSGAIVPVFSTLLSGTYGTPIVYTVRVTVNWTAPPVSKSGIYKFGFLEWFFADSLTGYYVRVRIPTLLVDADTPGVYNAVMFDLSTAFYSLSVTMRSLENSTLGRILWAAPNPAWLDYSFNDEQLFKLGVNDVIGRDFNGDGIIDFGVGAIAGAYIDSYGLANYTYSYPYIYLGQPGEYPGLDPNGKYIAVLTDWHGHGTSVATVIAARGRLNYTGYGGTYKLFGVAPEAKLSAGTGFFFGDLIPVEYWLGGWDWVYDPTYQALYPVPSGIRRADIISNSWGYINLAKWGHQGPGMDYLSAVFDQIIAVNLLINHNVTIVFAAGNYGPGYTTISSPGADLLIIEVAATTNFEYFQMYGFPPGYNSDIIPFSSRGPNALGYPKPDVAAVGAWEWAGVRTIDGRGYGAVGYNEGAGGGLTLFGGTSEATPFTSGVLALGVQAFMAKYGYIPSPVDLKVLVKSSANDVKYPALEQGSGQVNAFNLVSTIMSGGFTAYLTQPIANAFIENYANVYGDYTSVIAGMLADTALYAVVPPGSSYNFTINVNGRGFVSARAVWYQLIREVTVYDGVYRFTTSLFTLPRLYFADGDYVEFYIQFKNLTYTPPYYGQLPSSSGYMIRADVFDYYGGKLYRLTTDAKVATEDRLPVGNVSMKVRGDMVIRLRPNPSAPAPTPVAVRIVARVYKEIPAPFVSFNMPYLFTYINGTGTISGRITIPSMQQPGVYDVKILVYTPSKTIVIPATIIVPLVLDDKGFARLSFYRSFLSYDSYTPVGLADPVYGRYTESLDWRLVPVYVTDLRVAGFLLQASWSSGPATSLEVLVQPPGGAFLPSGDLNLFSAYKLTASIGYVYNPNPNDQLAGVLRLYVPVKWPSLYAYATVYTHYRITVSPSSYSEIILAMGYAYPGFQPGLYRLLIAFNSYSGSLLYDPVKLDITVVRAYQVKTQTASGLSVTAYFSAPSITLPLLGAKAYSVTDGSVVGASLSTIVLGTRVFQNGSSTVILAGQGYYLGSSSNGIMYTVAYTVQSPTYVETVLTLPNVTWHSTGLYYYNTTSNSLVVFSIAYNAVVSTGF
ncbi:S8 family serine peptidase [Thermogladius sp. 4427co]|uniref:S8 family serine peptidase n=1 Tax=Thermogladius sp. 4427co TaxID=3450718 RepID=UPI003F7AFE3D